MYCETIEHLLIIWCHRGFNLKRWITICSRPWVTFIVLHVFIMHNFAYAKYNVLLNNLKHKTKFSVQKNF